MAIIQISKMQQRSGDLVDLPQLDEGELGWASDEGLLFIGKNAANANIENVEVLTSYSNISFSQLEGSAGNLDITSPVTGQVLVYKELNDTWTNAGGNALDPGNSTYWTSNAEPIHLGNVENLHIGGGATGYILETDGLGNLSWTPKGIITANISNATQANPVVITTSSNNFFTDGDYVTITNVSGMTQLNGNSYYANVLTANTFSLYSDSSLTTSVDGTGFSAYTGNGRAIASIGGSGGTTAGGANTQVQYNNSGILDADANLTYDFASKILSVNGNANVGNLNANGIVTSTRFTSNIATGTAPLTITSTTRVNNLNVAYSNVSDFGVVTAQTTGTFFPVFVNGSSTANRALGANANLGFDAATGNLSATILNANGNVIAGNLTTAGVLSVTGNANIGNIGTVGLITATGNINGGNINTGGVLSVTGNANIGNIGTAGLITATGNITGGNLNTAGVLSVTGNANIGNIGTAGLITATGNVSGGNLITGGLVTATGNVNGGNINTGGIVSAIGNISGGNLITIGDLSVTGNANIGNIGTAGLITATGNITGGNLVTSGVLSVTGNANIGNIGTTGLITATGNIQGANLVTAGVLSVTGNANIGNIGTTGLITATGNITGGNLVTSGVLSVTGNANIGNIGTAGLITATGNIDGGNLITTGLISATGNVSAGNITLANAATISGNNMTLTTGANTNTGTITGNWTLSSGSRLEATYADLAEYYQSDKFYPSGTVLEFGGEQEVTLATENTTKVAGVVSSDPAYAMNAKCPGIAMPIALQGRVPCKVSGTISKGDMMVSAGNGFAKSCAAPILGSVIGKSLENFSGTEGVIEIAIGRL